MASCPSTSWQIDGEKWKQWQISFSWAPKSLQMVTAATKLKDPCSLEEKLWQPDSILTRRDITLSTKIPIVKTMIFSSSHVQIWELDHKEDWALKNCCFQIVVLEKTLESPLDSKEINPVNPKGTVNPKGNQPWIFTGRTNGSSGHLMQTADSLGKAVRSVIV